MERYEREPLSPAGQIDAWGDLASGWRSNPRGRRRALRMLLWLAVLAAVVAGLVLLFV